jgi:hypothetical protein
MLLYDQVREHAERLLRRIGPDAFGETNLVTLRALHGAVVYELSDVIPLFGDWEREKDRAVPKRPPHPVVWAEWRYADYTEDGLYGDDWTLAALIAPLPEAFKADLLAHPPRPLGEGGWVDANELAVGEQRFRDFLSVPKEYYLVHQFKRLDRSCLNPAGEGREGGRVLTFAERQARTRERINRPSCDLGTFLWSQAPDGSAVRRYKLIRNDPSPLDSSVFFLPILYSSGVRHWQCADPWPAFMAFALLHCKNVVTEEHVPDERLQRRVRKAGNPPRVTYKTLRLEVPATVHHRQGYAGGSEDDGPRVRFHLCRGHFKDLRHERYRVKGLHWWPAHWRGTKDLGEVHKTYKLEGRSQGARP